MYWKINYKGLRVCYSWRLNGGGIILADEFVRIVSKKIGKVEHVFEYCAGPGFIGFALLAHNLCDRLTLSDVNPQAIEAIKETIKNNNLQDKVTVYQSDCLDSIPKTEQWDLVVSNPPWYLCSKDKKDIIVFDQESLVHEKFYRGINKFLKPNGSILFVEGGEYTNLIHFKDMIENGGLRVVDSFSPVSFSKIFDELNEYKGLRIPFAIFLRVVLLVRQVYFIWSKPDASNKNYGQEKKVKPAGSIYSKGEIAQIAKKQKMLSRVFLGLLFSYLFALVLNTQDIIWAGSILAVIRLVLSFFSIWAVLAVLQSLLALKNKWLGLYIFLTVIPVVNLIVILRLIWESGKVLKTNKAGFNY